MAFGKPETEEQKIKKDRCRALLAKLEKRRDQIEEGYLLALEQGFVQHDNLSSGASDLLRELQAFDDHIKEMKDQISE